MAVENITQEPDNLENTKYKPGVNRNARLSIKNVSFKATEDGLKEYFSSFGNVEEVKLLKRPDGKLVGCGFVHFTQVSMANEALKANKKPFLGRPMTVTWAVPKHKYEVQPKEEGSVTVKEEDQAEEKDKNKNKTKINRNARLIIRNISFKSTQDSLKEFFEPYGTVQEVELLKKPDGKLVGCAFVSFANVPMAKAALVATNTKPFLGRPISVDWAVAKDKYMRHVVNRQLEMQDAIKKEESDSDDDGEPINITTDDVKDEVKSETDSDSNKSSESESEDENSAVSENDEDEDSDDDEDEAENDDEKSETSTQLDRQRLKSNDAEDGCTVFVTNIPFNVDNEQLRQFAEDIAPVKYALVCVDKMTEHSRGSGFVKFTKSEDADAFLSLSADKLRLGGQVLKVRPALLKDNLTNNAKKQPKDNRNLYLVKEGVIVAGTKAAEGVSALDMAKRLALERNKTQMLKNLNRFVSRYRLVVSNLPEYVDDARLRAICSKAAVKGAVITEARVMKDLRDPKRPSKGYGFVMFMQHENALACLRKLNNNPDIFNKTNRPIVSFSIEDRVALNARKKRLEKSIQNNTLPNNRKRKGKPLPDESSKRKRKTPVASTVGQFVRRPKEQQVDEYTGLTAKEGSRHNMRTSFKLKKQAELHKANLKQDKKTSQRAIRRKKIMRERIKLPKQKINKTPNKKRSKRKYN